MIEFAVHIPGHHKVEETTPEEREKGATGKQASWVLAVNHDSVLIPHEDGSLHWHAFDKCEFLQGRDPLAATVITAAAPLPVFAVEEVSPEEKEAGPELVLPPNRMTRRHPE